MRNEAEKSSGYVCTDGGRGNSSINFITKYGLTYAHHKFVMYTSETKFWFTTYIHICIIETNVHALGLQFIYKEMLLKKKKEIQETF